MLKLCFVSIVLMLYDGIHCPFGGFTSGSEAGSIHVHFELIVCSIQGHLVAAEWPNVSFGAGMFHSPC